MKQLELDFNEKKCEYFWQCNNIALYEINCIFFNTKDNFYLCEECKKEATEYFFKHKKDFSKFKVEKL